jgi:hypothetical protein
MKIIRLILLLLFSPFVSIYEMFKEDFGKLFCSHDWDYRDIQLKCDDHDGIDGTIFRNHFRKCKKCSKCQKGLKTPGNWGKWQTIPEMDFTIHPKYKPIVHEVRLWGSPRKKSKQEIRQDKLDELLSK